MPRRTCSSSASSPRLPRRTPHATRLWLVAGPPCQSLPAHVVQRMSMYHHYRNILTSSRPPRRPPFAEPPGSPMSVQTASALAQGRDRRPPDFLSVLTRRPPDFLSVLIRCPVPAPAQGRDRRPPTFLSVLTRRPPDFLSVLARRANTCTRPGWGSAAAHFSVSSNSAAARFSVSSSSAGQYLHPPRVGIGGRPLFCQF